MLLVHVLPLHEIGATKMIATIR